MTPIREAVRALRAAPIVSGVAVLLLALGIGANTAVFSILNSLLLRSLPVHEPERLMFVQVNNGNWTNPMWEALRARESLVGGAMAWGNARFNLAQSGPTDFADGLFTSGAYFEVLGVQPLVGRTFTRDDDARRGGPAGPVAVISYRFWQRRFGGDPDVVGRPITLDRVPFTIVGITRPGFFGADVGREFEVAVPIGTEPLMRGRDSSLDRRSSWWLNVIARLKPGQSLDEAQTALRGVQQQIRDETMPQDWGVEDQRRYISEPFTLASAAAGQSGLRARYGTPLQTIMVIVALVLLIACANIALLLLARATARRREMSIRLALGASRRRLMTQLLAESLLLAGAGALAGLAFAQWGGALLVRQLSTQATTVTLNLALDWQVLGFTMAVAVATAVVFGLAPAWRAARVHPNDALKEQGRGVAGDGRATVSNVLVVLQVAFSLVLIVGAALFVRTFTTLFNRDLGFDRDPVLVVNVNARGSATLPADRAALYERVRQAVGALPGVSSAAVSVITPISGSTWQYALKAIDGVPNVPSERGVFINQVSADWFKTFSAAMVSGRDFDGRDVAGATPVAIVNEAFARERFGDVNPIGRRLFRQGWPGNPAQTLEIVGIARNAAYRSVREPLAPTVYVPIAQVPEPQSTVTVSVKVTGGSPATLARAASAAIAGVDPNLTTTARPLADFVNAALTQERLVAMLSGFFGVLALLLAGIGLYGVTSHAVSRRRTEMGVRLALGAQPSRVVRLILSRATLLVAIGLVAGAGASLWAGRYIATLLYGLLPTDVVTVSGAALVLLFVGALAGWVPARRASKLDPARVFREG